jgi:gas vesicle protein GvpL/GvpF
MKGTRPTATYLYCVVRSGNPPRVTTAPRGIPGAARPRVLPVAERLWLVVADAPLARYGDEAIAERLQDLRWVSAVAMAHEHLVEHFQSAEALLPMKLFTLFASDARAVGAIRRQGRRLERVLDRVAGREEWGVRVLLDEAARTRRRGVPRDAAHPVASGTRFLLAKRAARDARADTRRDAVVAADALYRRLADVADAAHRRDVSPVETATLVLDAAFLVPRRRARSFRATAARAARTLAGDGCRVTLTGPWPPYNFVTARS